MRVDGEKVVLGPLKEEAIREYKERIRKRKELIRFLWSLCDFVKEEEVEKVLREFIEAATKSKG